MNYVKHIKLILLFTVFAVLSGCASAAATPEVAPVSTQIQSVVETDRIYDFISINGIPVGGLTKADAYKKVEEELSAPFKNQKIIVTGTDSTWPLELTRLGYKYDIAKAVDEAYSVARTGDTEERFAKITELAEKPYEITIEPVYDKNEIDRFLDEIAEKIDVPAVEPSLTRVNREVVTTKGYDGLAVDKAETKEKIMMLTDGLTGGEVPLVVTAVAPKFTTDDLLKAHALIGSYSTPITGSASRDVNLTVASGYVNGVTLYPGETFSTNETIGPTTYDRGYRNAPVIVNGKLEDGIGGGVCQVSSTLYNAVLFSELEIVQRQNHSLVVGYCPIGRDATLAGDVIDFKFKNNLDYPIYIESYLEAKKLYVNIYGQETRPAGRTLDFESVYVSSTAAPPAVETPDPTLPEGEKVVVTTSLGGSVVDVYKKIMVDGVVTEKVYVDRSNYRARAGEVRVGTGPAAPGAPVDTAPPAPEELPAPSDNSEIPEWLNTEQPVTPMENLGLDGEIGFDLLEQ